MGHHGVELQLVIPNLEVLNEWISIFDLPVDLEWTQTGYLECFLDVLFHKSFLRVLV